MNRPVAESPVVPTDIFLTHESHRYYLQVTERTMQQHSSVAITYADARAMVPPLLADAVLRRAVLLGFFGTFIAIAALWGFTLQYYLDTLIIPILGTAVLIVLGIWVAFFFYESSLERFFYGTALSALIVQTDKVDKDHYALTYEFTTPAGLLKSRTTTSAWAKTDAFALPPTGTPVTIYYIDDSHFWLL